MTLMNRSKLTVMVIVALAAAALVGLYFHIDQRGDQRRLADIPCRTLLATAFQLQGKPVLVSSSETCELMRTVAGMTPLDGEHGNEPGDPWHYFGRLRISPEDDVWFLVFIARRSENYRPLFSLLHRNGNGWSVVGMFDAAPVLRQLGVDKRIDWEQVKSPAALAPVDQTTPM